MAKDLIPSTVERPDTERKPITSDAPEIGRWYWVNRDSDDDKREPERWLGCVVHVGSNYVEIHGPNADRYESTRTRRVHFDGFWEICTFEPNADAVINGKIEEHKSESGKLMLEVQQLTALLGVTPRKGIADGGAQSEAQALSIRTGAPVEKYKKDLVKAKEKTLPDLFKQIEGQTALMGTWMKAKLIPMKAEAQILQGSIGRVEDRIFSVELYAGLVEEAEKIREGAPARDDERIRLMQRRCYMDEECLAGYETGGMDWKKIGDFDRWLSKPKNMNRILPFPRSMVAFRVRRYEKERRAFTIAGVLENMAEAKADKLTFLYIRNGEQLFRMSTQIEFDERLFPDIDRAILGSGQALYVKSRPHGLDDIITEGEYQERIRIEAMDDEEYEKLKDSDKRFTHRRHWRFDNTAEHFFPFTPSNVYYDDANKILDDERKKHNRLVLILQGILDRSPMVHPHPPWQLWTVEGFNAGVELIYDDSRALAPAGGKPDFEAYRARLNAHLRAGSLTVGQEVAWEMREAIRYNQQRENAGETHYHDYERYRPHGDPGPGRIAKVVRYKKASGACVYEWERTRRRGNQPREVPAKLMTGEENVLNIDAYKPGDFHIFFDDPRTRLEYLQWAPLLIEAEECHAGNRELKPNPVTLAEGPVRQKDRGERPVDLLLKKPTPRKPLSESYDGKLATLIRDITTRGGKKFKRGETLRVSGYYRKRVTLADLKDKARCVCEVDVTDFRIVGEGEAES